MFGKNPHVPKAEAAELKAHEAKDTIARVRAHREAAHLWDRAAEREKPGKTRALYEANAVKNREIADNDGAAPTPSDAEGEPSAPSPKVWN